MEKKTHHTWRSLARCAPRPSVRGGIALPMLLLALSAPLCAQSGLGPQPNGIMRASLQSGDLVGEPGFSEPARQTSLPYSDHEVLEYQVKWNPPAWMFFMPQINAGRVIFTVLGRTIERGLAIQKFKGTAISTSTFVKVNDRFESSSSGDNFCALHILKETHEGKRHREVDVTIHPESRSAQLVEKDIGQTPPRIIKDDTLKDFPVCATDVLSALYRARTLPLQPGQTYPLLLTDNGRAHEITLKPLAHEYIQNKAGFFKTRKVEVLSFFGGLVKQKGTFYIWFTDDARHLPVKFDVKVKLGRVFGNLVKVQE